MKESRVFFALIFTILLVMCFAYHSRLMPLLLVAVTVAVILSYILALIARMRFAVNAGNVPAEIERRGEAVLTLKFRNGFILPLTPVRVYARVLDCGRAVPAPRMMVFDLPPLAERVLNIRNVASFRGEYEIGVEKIEFFDLLRLFRFAVEFEKPWTLVSYPRELPSDDSHTYNEDEDETTHAKSHGLDINKNTFSHLREYRRGDALRHIHWKLSARDPDGALIVKQMEANCDYAALILCDFTAQSAQTQTTEALLEASDRAIETVQAVARQILFAGNSALLVWQDSRTNRAEVKEIATPYAYSEVKRTLATLPPEPFPAESGTFADVFDEFRAELRPERAVYIVTGRVTDELADKLRENSMIYRRNVVLFLTGADENYPQLQYIKENTHIHTCMVHDS